MADVLSDDHPLALELTSLRATASRYQHEAHSAALKLQRHSLEASQALEHARALERENVLLKEEVTTLRAHPGVAPSETATQVPELTLALRKLSDKLTAVEGTLLERTKEAVDVRSELANAQHEVEAARALAAEASAREEEGLARERELERQLRRANEEQRMADLVVQEYASLVRKLEGRPKTHSSTSSVSSIASGDVQRAGGDLVDTLSEGKLGLQRLMGEFNGQSERLQSEIAKLHGDNGMLYKELEAARQGAEHDRTELAKALHELDKYRADDNTATRMVSRYMKFSQTSTDTLQRAMDALKTRHTATLATLTGEIAQLERAAAHERAEAERVRGALDELTEDIAREAFGRRREVALRLAFLGREEGLAEGLRRWVRSAKEAIERTSDEAGLGEAFAKAIARAEVLLDTLNGQPTAEGKEVGSIARLVLAQDTVASLTQELQTETIRRLTTERKLAQLPVVEHASEGCRDGVVQPVPHRIAEVHESERLLDAQATPSAGSTQDSEVPTPEVVADSVAVSVPTTPTSPPSQEAFPVIGAPPELENSLDLQMSNETGTGETPTDSSSVEPDSAPMSPATAVPTDPPPARAPKLHIPPPLPLEATNGLALSSLTPSMPIASLPSGESGKTSLLADLARVKHRYDDVQRGFRDCHLALKELRQSLAAPSQQPTDVHAFLRTAVERLGDVNEDARVELEIRIADEERVASGYTALLAIPGALAASAADGSLSASGTGAEAEVDVGTVSREVRAFVDGSEGAVARARRGFAQKLDDLEHDIAAIKRALHDPALSSPAPSAAPDAVPSARTASPGWSAWTPHFLNPSSARPASPAPPTFGSVMTSPRLRAASSVSHLRERAASASSDADDPLARLGLRIVTPPARGSPVSPYTHSGVAHTLGAGAPPGHPGARQRTMSGMFMLGLGMRSAGTFGPTPVPTPRHGHAGGVGLHKMPSRSSLAGMNLSASASAGPGGTGSIVESKLESGAGERASETKGGDAENDEDVE